VLDLEALVVRAAFGPDLPTGMRPGRCAGTGRAMNAASAQGLSGNAAPTLR
jgi:hypothetical protein